MTLTEEQIKKLKKIIWQRMAGYAGIEFILECDECSKEEDKIFDILSHNPHKWSFGDLWVKVKYDFLNEQYWITAGWDYRW